MARPTFVVVGSSLAGCRAVQGLRTAGYEGRLVLVSEEEEEPYDRPPLSKEYLRGEKSRGELAILPRGFLEDQEVERRFGCRAVRLHERERELELESGERLVWDALLLATGGRVRRLRVPGADLEGIHYLRDLADSERLRQAATAGGKAVVVGAGFIGLEVAASLRQCGLEVTCLEAAPVPLEHAVGREVGRFLARLHREEGVDLRLEEQVVAFRGGCRVEAVETHRGAYPCDFAVVGVGIAPNVDLAEGTSLPVDDGILVDERCRTSVEGIYAAGDVARFFHPFLGERVRLEHWTHAVGQGAAAAANMMGREKVYDELPFFWTDQYGVNLQMVGYAREWDEVVFRGEVGDRDFIAYYLREDRLVMALAVNRFRDLRAARKLILERRPVTAAELAGS